MIKRIEARGKSVVGQSLNLTMSTICTIYSQHKEILACLKTFGSFKVDMQSLITTKTFFVMKRLLEEYIWRQKRNNMALSTMSFQQQVMKFFGVTSEKYPLTHQKKFTPSTGWLSSFARREHFKNN